MKRIEELKISPAPWRKAVNVFGNCENLIWDANSSRVAYCGQDPCFSRENQEANHTMLVASPEMYTALWNLCYGDIGLGNCRNCIGMGGVKGNCEGCMFKEAKESLAKASGEEVKGK